MAQGFLTGLLWGGVAGVGLLAVSTQLLVRQDLTAATKGDVGQPEAQAVEVPAGTEFDQAREATDPEIPAEETRPGGEAVSGVTPPADLGTTPPAFDTSALEMPQPVETPGGLGEVPAPAEEVSLGVTGPGESVPDIAPVEPLATPNDTTPAPETDTAAPQITAPDTASDAEVEPTVEDLASNALSDTAPQMAEEDVAVLTEAPETPGEAPSAPQTPTVMDLPEAPPTTDAPAVMAESEPSRPEVDEAPEQPTVTDTAPIVSPEAPVPPAQPEEEERAEETTADMAETPPAESDETPAPVDEIAETPEQVEAPEVEMAEPEQEPATEVNVATVEPEPEADPAPAPEPQPEAEPSEADPNPAEETTSPRVRPAPGTGGGLPRVIRLIGDEEEPAVEADEETELTEVEPVDPDAPAIERFGVPMDIGIGDAIMSVVILHEGAAPAAASVAALPEGLAFAVDAGASEADAVARVYRDAGREVVMIPNLPEKARPQDVEQAMQANLRSVPEAVAVMDTTGGGFQSDREAVAQVVDAIGATGHGLITFPRGLNTAHQRAEREGVPRGLIFRDIDAKGESGAEIGRSLDRAAFRARQSRQPVILVGRSSETTLEAVAAWAAENAGGGVVLAPVSAALLAGN